MRSARCAGRGAATPGLTISGDRVGGDQDFAHHGGEGDFPGPSVVGDEHQPCFATGQREQDVVAEGLGDASQLQPFTPNESGFALRVADVPAAVEEVKAAGGEVIGIEDSGVCHMGFVRDPDGNVIILHRRYAPRVAR